MLIFDEFTDKKVGSFLWLTVYPVKCQNLLLYFFAHVY